MRVTPKLRKDDAHLVTEARQSRSADISSRERRYLIMMGFRIVCFALAVVLFTQGAGWYAAIPAVGAIVLPYFAVVIANGGREPARPRAFREYEPNLPAVHSGTGQAPDSKDGDPGRPGSAEPSADGTSGTRHRDANGAPRGNAGPASTPPSGNRAPDGSASPREPGTPPA